MISVSCTDDTPRYAGLNEPSVDRNSVADSYPDDYPLDDNNKTGDDVIAHVGASLVRDDVDAFFIDQVLSYGTKGQIINTEDDNGIARNVGTVTNGTPPTDSYRDGMPDAWERARGLNPIAADDRGDDDGDGYTNIEEYLSCIAGDVSGF